MHILCEIDPCKSEIDHWNLQGITCQLGHLIGLHINCTKTGTCTTKMYLLFSNVLTTNSPSARQEMYPTPLLTKLKGSIILTLHTVQTTT